MAVAGAEPAELKAFFPQVFFPQVFFPQVFFPQVFFPRSPCRACFGSALRRCPARALPLSRGWPCASSSSRLRAS